MKKIFAFLLVFSLIGSISHTSAQEKILQNINSITQDIEIAGVTFNRLVRAGAVGTYRDSKYSLEVDFFALPKAPEGYFYEGWIVNQSTGDFLSTGKLTLKKHTGNPENVFKSDEDLRLFNYYILTLEPDDNDPAPADHIIEGKIKIVTFLDSKKKNEISPKKIETKTQSAIKKESRINLIEKKLSKLPKSRLLKIEIQIIKAKVKYRDNSKVSKILDEINTALQELLK